MEMFKSADFAKHVDDLLEEWHVPGLAIAVVENGVVASQGYGSATLGNENGMPVTPDTVFDIASSSKSLTAAAVAMLVADDQKYPDVKWDTPISKLLPEDFVMAKEEYTKSITLEDILSHRTGLPSHDFSYLSPRAKDPDTAQSVTRNLRNLEISAPIRTKFMYCNMMYTVAAYLVEQLSGLSFEAFLRRNFWEPLGMSSTILQPTKAMEAGLPIAQPYKWQKDSNDFLAVERQYSPEAIGAGLIVTSVKDYIKWVKAMMYKETPVSEEIYHGLTKPRSFANDESDTNPDPFTSPGVYGAGLGSQYYRGVQVVSHDGGDPGVSSKHFFLPQIKFGAVMLGNSGTASNVIEVLSHELIDAALRVPSTERPDWNSREHELVSKDELEDEQKNREWKSKLCPETDTASSHQQTPLTAYVGQYWNAGYHGMIVEISQDGKLVIDATDRTMGFLIKFEHLSDNTKYIAHRVDYYEGEDDEMAAEFVFERGRVVRMGLDLESDLDERRVWFDRVETMDLPNREHNQE